MTSRRPLLSVLLVVACAGAHGERRSPPTELTFAEPSLIEGRPLDPSLAGLNEDELFARGEAAAGAEDPAAAAATFEAFAHRFPGSLRANEALMRAGLAWRSLARSERALPLFEALAGTPAADEAALLAAEALEELGRRADAWALLDERASRSETASGRARALAERGILELADGKLDVAEHSLLLSLASVDPAAEAGAPSPLTAARAHFFLGEVARQRFENEAVDTARSPPDLAAALERKADLLLLAEERYLSAARDREPSLGVAAGARIGQLYETFYRELVAAPIPSELDSEGGATYRALLHERVRVLLEKAAQAYAETVDAALHAGLAESPFAKRAGLALEEIERTLVRDEAPAAPRADRAR
jgi:hypothetical protein